MVDFIDFFAEVENATQSGDEIERIRRRVIGLRLFGKNVLDVGCGDRIDVRH